MSGENSGITIVTGDGNIVEVHNHDPSVKHTGFTDASTQVQPMPSGSGSSRPKLGGDSEHPDISELRGKIDILGKLYQQGQLTTTLAVGVDVQQTIPFDTPADLKHRFFTVLSSSYLQLGQLEDARKSIEESLAAEPGNLDVRENAANVNLMVGDLERAEELSRQVLSRQDRPASLSVLLQTTFQTHGRQAVDELLAENPWGEDAQIVQTALAVTYMQENNLAEAEKWLRRDLPDEPTEPHEADQLTYLAEIQIENAQQTFTQALRAPWLGRVTECERLDEAIGLCDKVVRFWEGKEPHTKHGRALAERATAKLLSGQLQPALTDLDEVAKLGVEDDLSRHARARLLLILDQPDELVAAASTVPLAERTKGYEGLLGAAYVKRKEYRLAADAFEREVPKAELMGERLAVLESLLDMYMQLGDEVEAERVRGLLETEGANHAPSIGALATYHYQKGEREKAHELFRQALEMPAGSDLVRVEYAQCLAKENRWDEVADLLEPLASPSAPAWFQERYAASLLNAGRYGKALTFTQEYRQRHGVTPVISAVEADLRHMAADYSASIPLLLELEKLEPNELRHPFNLLAAYIGLCDVAKARDVLNGIDPMRVREQPRRLMWLAQAAQGLGLPGVLELAWEAQRAAPADHDLFVTYVNILVKVKDIDSDTAVIAIDTTATVTLPSGNTAQFTLLDRRDVEPDEINLEDKRATKLLGQRVGDRIPWGQGMSGPTYAEIIQVRHKYVARFQDTNPNDLPSERPSAELLELKDGELPPAFIEYLERNAEMTKQLYDGYASKSIWSLHTLALFSGNSLPATRQTLRNQDRTQRAFEATEILVPNHRGQWRMAPIDALRHRRVLRSKRVVLDESALLTLADLDILELLEQRFDEVMVPQTVVNSLDTEVARITGLLDPAKLPDEAVSVVRARAWVRSHATVIPAYDRLLGPSGRLERFGQALPHHCLDALLAAEAQSLPLYTDDGGLANLITIDWQVDTTNTRHLLDDSVDMGLMSSQDYARNVAKLIELDYSFVAFNALHLLVLFAKEGTSPAFRQLVGKLGSPEVLPASSLRVAIGFLDHLSSEHPQSDENQSEAIGLILDRLAVNHPPESIVRGLRRRFSSPRYSYLRQQLSVWFGRQRKG